MDWTAEWPALWRVLLAGGLGACIGLERELSAKPAGLRTHVFVCAGAALLMLLSESVVLAFAGQPEGDINIDPIRVIQAIVIGISFLGTGTIIHEQGRAVEGLTTASSIYLTSGIGIAVAADEFVLAAGTTLFAVSVLCGLGWIERRIRRT